MNECTSVSMQFPIRSWLDATITVVFSHFSIEQTLVTAAINIVQLTQEDTTTDATQESI